MSNLLRSNVLDQQLDLINLIFWPDFINYISTAWINQLYGLNLSNSYQQQFDAINLLYWHHQLDLIYINSLNLLTWYDQLDLVKLMLGIWFNHLYHIYINRLNYFPCFYQFAVINFIWLIDTSTSFDQLHINSLNFQPDAIRLIFSSVGSYNGNCFLWWDELVVMNLNQ